MDRLVIIRNLNHKYYVNGEFTQVNKNVAEKLNLGLAIRIVERLNKHSIPIKTHDGNITYIPYATIEYI